MIKGSIRKQVFAIVCSTSRGYALHFTSGPLQTTYAGTDLWFPISDYDAVFTACEDILCLHRIANNVVQVEEVNTGETFTDFLVTYNEYPGVQP